MVHVCVIPGCSNCSDRETHLSYFHLPVKNKRLLKMWIHHIQRKNLPLNGNLCVCSDHFVNTSKRLLHVDGYPTVKIPKATVAPIRKQKQLAKRVNAEPVPSDKELSIIAQGNDGEDAALPTTADIGVQTIECFDDY